MTLRVEELTYNYPSSARDMAGSGCNSWGNIPLSARGTEMLSQIQMNLSTEPCH